MTERGQRITLQDEGGAAHEFTLVDVLEVEGKQYAVLQPDDPAAGAALFLLRRLYQHHRWRQTVYPGPE